MAESHHPKVEPYDGVLYVILHGIVAGKRQHGFATRDVDFFLGRNFLVTVHHYHSRSIRGGAEGAAAAPCALAKVRAA
jgi:magnesium transporter